MAKSMISTIKTVSAAVEAVLGKPATAEQVVSAIEAIEVLVGANKQVVAQPVLEERKTFIVKPRATKPKPKKRKRYVNWRQYSAWFDKMFDGQVHVITYHDLVDALPPLTGEDNDRIHSVIWTVARERGLRASIHFDNKLSLIRIHTTLL